MIIRGAPIWFLISIGLLVSMMVLELVNMPDMWMNYRLSWLVALFVVNVFLIFSFYFIGRPVAWIYGESLLSTSGKEWLLLLMADFFFFVYLLEAPAIYVLRMMVLDSTLILGLFFVNTHRERTWPVVTFILVLCAFNVLLLIRVFMLFSYALWRDDAYSVGFLLNSVLALLLFMGIMVKSLRKLIVPEENVLRPHKTLDDYELGAEYTSLFAATRVHGKEARIPVAVESS